MKRFLVGMVVVASIAAFPVRGSTRGAPQVSQSAADAWAVKWCQAQPGDTKEGLVAIMGQPTGSSPTTMSWSAHQYQFNAFLDSSGRVEQLDINTHSLSAAEQAALKCETVRTRATVARAARAASKAVAKAPRKIPAPCALVTEAEMSAILGAPVVAEARKGGNTECNYKPASGISPAVKLSVDWGDGKIAMASAGMMGRHEPGLTSPYDGIGDQAMAVGPALMIRTGEDLVTIVFTGVSGAPAKAKRIFETAKGRM
jgi:hypothetical protein